MKNCFFNFWSYFTPLWGVRDKEVLKALACYFYLLNSKNPENKDIKPYNISITKQSVSLHIRRFSDIISTIIPFFDKHPILGVKSLDFADFKKVAVMVNAKEHLTNEGLNRILEIKLNMNKHRVG